MTLMLISTALWADQTVTVSANSSDISEGLDLKVVAKLFAEAENLEQFETMLNNPDSAFCNLDLNGDGEVDYLRVVETGEGNKRLIVLQAILAKDIYQDVASIYVEKDDANNVSVQIVGDEYVYGTNYIIEPVYVYRPVIYDWFWSDVWFAWHSPWYWGYYPGWWYVHRCWAHDWYWNHCYAYHHHHHCCSFRPARSARHGYHELHSGVTRRDYATAHPEHSFSRRNSGMTNAREIRSTTSVRSRQAAGQAARQTVGEATGHAAVRNVSARTGSESRTFGSQHTAATRGASTTAASRSSSATAATRSSSATTATRSTGATASSRRTEATAASRPSAATRSSSAAAATRPSTATRSVSSSTGSTPTRSVSTTSMPSRSSSSMNTPRSSSSSFSSGSGRSSSFSSGSSHSSGGFSGGSSRGGGFSGGGGGRSGGSGSVRR